jgi:hypothetical protein
LDEFDSLEQMTPFYWIFSGIFINNFKGRVILQEWARRLLQKMFTPSPKWGSKVTSMQWLVEEGKPQTVANSVWACATLGVKAPALFAELDKNATWLVEQGDPQAVANSVWACATLGVKAPALFAELNKNATWLVEQGDPQAVANSVWACATLGVKAPALFAELDNATWLVEEGNPQNVANVAFALVVAGLDRKEEKEVVGRFWYRLMGMKIQQHSEVQLQQISYIQAGARAEGVELSQPPPKLQLMLDGMLFENADSKNQKEVSNQLRKFGFDHEYEVSPFECAPGLLAIDIACKERMIAIEYDEPSHFLKDTDFVELAVENGPTKAKRRMLQKLGWTVINLDWKEEIKHRSSSTKWLKNKLRSAGVDV